jgi:iron complex transport system substrate-binding protein
MSDGAPRREEPSGGSSPSADCRRSSGLVVALFFAAAAVWPAPPAAALRIVSLAPSVTETLFALGAGSEIVGVSAQCDYPAEASAIDRVGTFLEPNVELVLAKRPQLVIAAPSPGNETLLAELRRIGIEVLVVDADTVPETEAVIARIARAIGRPDRGTALVERIRAEISATTRRLTGAPVRRVLLVLGQNPLVAAGPGGLQDELIRMAHGENIAAGTGEPWPRLSLESVVARAPQVIIDLTLAHEPRGAARSLGIWQAFPSIPAVKQGRVYAQPAFFLVRPGPRLGRALEQMARFIHPERFAEDAADAR